MGEETCKDCQNRIGKCCKVTGDIVADLQLSNHKGHTVGIDETVVEDYFRPTCSQYKKVIG